MCRCAFPKTWWYGPMCFSNSSWWRSLLAACCRASRSSIQERSCCWPSSSVRGARSFWRSAAKLVVIGCCSSFVSFVWFRSKLMLNGSASLRYHKRLMGINRETIQSKHVENTECPLSPQNLSSHFCVSWLTPKRFFDGGKRYLPKKIIENINKRSFYLFS